jgi:3-oxoacyl-[acyl-carrier-protein] synthase II
MSRRVVITGIGILSSIGIGKEAFMQNLFLEQIPLAKIPDSFEKNYKFKSKYYVRSPLEKATHSENKKPPSHLLNPLTHWIP